MRPSEFSGLTPGSGHSQPLATQAKKLCLLRFSLGPNIQQVRKRGFSYEVNLSWKSVSLRDSGPPWGIQKEESLLCWSIDGDRGFGGRLSRCDSWRWDFYFPFFARGVEVGGTEGGWGMLGLLLLYCYEHFNENNWLTLIVTIAPSIGFIRFPNCSDLKQLLKWPFKFYICTCSILTLGSGCRESYTATKLRRSIKKKLWRIWFWKPCIDEKI